MSLKVPCKHCGKTISLRKMPNGQFIPFDLGANTQHHCQDQPPKSADKSGAYAKPHVDTGTSVGDLVLSVIQESPGMRARRIAATITRKYGVNVDHTEVNRWLYYDLKGKVYQNGSYQWFPGSESSGANPTVPTRVNHPPNPPVEPAAGSGGRGSNKLLWAIIVLLVIVVLMLLRKH